MNKSDLIYALSEKEDLSAKNAFEIVNLVFDGFTDTLKKGGRLYLLPPVLLFSSIGIFIRSFNCK